MRRLPQADNEKAANEKAANEKAANAQMLATGCC